MQAEEAQKKASGNGTIVVRTSLSSRDPTNPL